MNILISGLTLFIIFISSVGFTQERPKAVETSPPLTPPLAKGGNKGGVISELELLVKTLENAQEREKFLTQLKAFIELQKSTPHPATSEKGAEGKEAPILAKRLKSTNIFALYQRLSQQIRRFPSQFKENSFKIPNYFFSMGLYLSKRENVYFVLDIIIKGVLAGCIGVLLFYLARKYFHKYKQFLQIKGVVSLYQRIKIASADIAIEIIPFIGLLFSWLIFASLLGIGTKLYSSVLVIIWALLLSKFFSTTAEKLFAPEDIRQRLIPLEDELASYLFVWANRFIPYLVYSYIPIGVLSNVGVSPLVPHVLWMLYKLGLIVLCAIFISQWEDTIKERWSLLEEGSSFRRFLIRSYNLVLGKLYILITLYILAILAAPSFGYSHLSIQMIYIMAGTLLVIALGFGLWKFMSFTFDKFLSVSKSFKERVPGLEVKLNRYIHFIHIGINILLFIIIVVLLFQVWGLNVVAFITTGVGGIVIKKAISITLTIGLALLIVDFCQYFVQRLLVARTGAEGKMVEMGRREKTFLPLLNNLVKYATFFISGIIILGQLGVNIGPILAGVGIIGLAVGFGAQSLVKDIISGFFILFEDLVSVGDVVVIKGTGGLVEEVNLRTIKMRDLAGNVHVIPNSNIDMITNMTKDYSRYVLDLGVSYREDVDEVIKILKEVGDELLADPKYAPDILEPLEILGVDDLGESQVTIKMRITTKPIKQWDIGRELKRRIKKTFDAKGIEIPFPHRTIYIGNPKYEAPQPLVVRLEMIRPSNLNEG